MRLRTAVAIAAVLYVARGVYRGLDFRPDLPEDLLALAAFLVVLASVAYVRRFAAAGQTDDPTATSQGASHGQSGNAADPPRRETGRVDS